MPSTHTDSRAVDRLLQHPALWRAGQLQRAPATWSTGFPELDAHLPGHGWPQSGLAELLLGTTGIGELRLLAPLIRQLSNDQTGTASDTDPTTGKPGWVCWINPPFTPYAPALEQIGINLERMLVINPRTHREAVWALEQISRSGACRLALAWLDEKQLSVQETRRLQFAAQQGHMLTCLFRPEMAAMTQSMAELRLQLAPLSPGTIDIEIRKRRGGWPVSGIQVTLDQSERPETVFERLAAWRRQRRQVAETSKTNPQPAPAGRRTARDNWSILGAHPASLHLETPVPVPH